MGFELNDDNTAILVKAVLTQAKNDYVKGRIQQEKGKKPSKDCNPDDVLQFLFDEDNSLYPLMTNIEPGYFLRRMEQEVQVAMK